MPPNPPPYALESYWDEKYSNNRQPFDWLIPPSRFETAISDALKKCPEVNPKIAHIGCGTSLLSFGLRNIVKDPEYVHNLDFSAQATDWGRSLEDQFVRHEKEQENQQARIESSTPKDGKKMKWIQTSLLSFNSIKSTCNPSYYSLVVDKSCSDSIACGDDVEVPSLFPMITPLKSAHISGHDSTEMGLNDVTYYVHPLHILALHLAYITVPGGIWLALSFSPERFTFLASVSCGNYGEALPLELLKQGFPNTSTLWEMERMDSVEGIEEHADNGQVVYRPKPLHYLYTLRRTNLVLALR